MRALRRALRRVVVRRRRFGVPARRRRAQPFFAAALRLRETLALALRRVVGRRRRFGVARFVVLFFRRRFGAAAFLVVRRLAVVFRRRLGAAVVVARRFRRRQPLVEAVEWRALSPGHELRRARRRFGAALRRFGFPRRSALRAFRKLRKDARRCAVVWDRLILLFLRVDAGLAFFLAERTFLPKACSSLSRLFASES